MASCKIYALLIWFNDRPITGSVLTLSNVVEPRKDFQEYKIEEVVKARCGKYGVVDAVIGMLAGENGKEEMIGVLTSKARFKQLILDLPVVQKMREEKTNEGNKSSVVASDNSVDETSDETSDKTSDKIPDKVARPKAVATVARPKAVAVSKTKAVKRKLSVDACDSKKNEKKLQSAAEDVALANLQKLISAEEDLDLTSLDTEKKDERMESSQLVKDSLSLVQETGLTPQKTPQHSAAKCNQEMAQLVSDNAELYSRVGHLEYTVSSMWHEMEKYKTQLFEYSQKVTQHTMTFGSPSTSRTYQQSAFSSPAPSHSLAFKSPASTFSSPAHTPLSSPAPTSTLNLPSPFMDPGASYQTDAADTQDDQVADNNNRTGDNNNRTGEKTYNGYIKSQVMSEVNMHSDYKKATAKLFRMLFTAEEIRGRSINGKKSKGGIQRPAIEDRGKLKFIEECILETWNYVPIESIRIVIRDMVKPSRLLQGPKNATS